LIQKTLAGGNASIAPVERFLNLKFETVGLRAILLPCEAWGSGKGAGGARGTRMGQRLEMHPGAQGNVCPSPLPKPSFRPMLRLGFESAISNLKFQI